MSEYRGSRSSGQKNKAEAGIKNTFIIIAVIIGMLTVGLGVTFGIKKVNFMLVGAIAIGFCVLILLPWFNHWFWKVYEDDGTNSSQIWKSIFPCRFFYKGPMIMFIVGAIIFVVSLLGYLAPGSIISSIYGDVLVGQSKFMSLLFKSRTISLALIWISLAWGYTGMAKDILADIGVINKYKAFINSAASISNMSKSTSANSAFIYIMLWIPMVQFFSIASLGSKLIAIYEEEIPIDVMEEVLEKAENNYDDEGTNDYYGDDGANNNYDYDYDFEDDDNDFY